MPQEEENGFDYGEMNDAPSNVSEVSRVLFSGSIAASTLALIFVSLVLVIPWYGEAADVQIALGSGIFISVAVHPFYWSYFCEGDGCLALNLGRDPNGIYSWYDACVNCDNQLSLYICVWIILFFGFLFLALSLFLHFTVFMARRNGYPCRGVSLFLPIFWGLAALCFVIGAVLFPSLLPTTIASDDSNCQNILNAIVDGSNDKTPCNSFGGSIDWDTLASDGSVFWGPALGYYLLILVLITSPLPLALSILISKRIRSASRAVEDVGYAMVPMELDASFSTGDETFSAPGFN